SSPSPVNPQSQNRVPSSGNKSVVAIPGTQRSSNIGPAVGAAKVKQCQPNRIAAHLGLLARQPRCRVLQRWPRAEIADPPSRGEGRLWSRSDFERRSLLG